MNNEKYLSEERYQKNNQKVKNIGRTLLIVGIIILCISFFIFILAFTGFGNTVSTGIQTAENGTINNSQMAKSVFGNIGLVAAGGFINTFGFTLTVIGAITMFIAHRREIAAYTTQQVMPVAQESIEKITPTVANAAGTIAQSISKGIKEGTKDTEEK